MTPDISVSAAATLSLAKAILDLGILLYSKIPPPPNETDLNNDLKFIKDEFMMMRAYLADAAKAGGYQTEAARTWITQVRNLAYDVEDYFQEFVLHLRTTKKPQKPRNTVVDQICGLKGRIHETNQRYKDYFLSPAFATGEARDPQKVNILSITFLPCTATEVCRLATEVCRHSPSQPLLTPLLLYLPLRGGEVASWQRVEEGRGGSAAGSDHHALWAATARHGCQPLVACHDRPPAIAHRGWRREE
ncbi:hypothetical protein PR202_gb16795 [Eleusine coracana subsp. coracana]|uniref:Disease resistance N-terminal domain-containing protein n=1 Tax=Eleusine coracana subsp. coracana TaxID=191504 RepID=A0AAV5F168_ELECO|nr:hypothetical protein PR202_gb16738 [Eleusine coracana subsp. coracana]GJN28647.1 hypothetical protein PR202_gb16795 [Eleusine coracana subsp. coracana]